jgi:hypothetical protein
MKIGFVVLCACVVLLTAKAGFPAEVTSNEKNLCLLASEDCRNKAFTLQEKIRLLQNEITKGTRVYTPDEIRKLQDKLDEANKMLDVILYGPSHK